MIVFAGPSLPSDVRPDAGELEWRPPAQAGDLLRLVADPPERVLLIDGYFDTRPAVTHKECLALMAAGTTLVGAASMGALRYAELAPFGMLGSGRIAQDYAKGALVGDDEVALVHGDARIGWKATSIAMVDVRATLAKCEEDGLITPQLSNDLRARWHEIHYAERDWPLMRKFASRLADTATLQSISDAQVQQKQNDALEAIDFTLGCHAEKPPSTPPRTRWVRKLEAAISSPPARP